MISCFNNGASSVSSGSCFCESASAWILREYRWSSWRIYAGAESAPAWLETGVVGRAWGGGNRAERQAALKAYTEQPVRQGGLDSPWAGLGGGIVLGEAEYARKLLS